MHDLFKQKVMRIVVKVVISLFIFSLGHSSFAQDSDVANYKSEILKYRKGKNIKLKFGDKTPLTVDQVRNFEGLKYFPVDYKYYVKAKLVKAPEQKKLVLQTSTDRQPEYIKYGQVHFMLDTFHLVLTVYQTPPDKQPLKEDRTLFVPFKDETSGKESYGGGRYIEFEIPVEGDTVYLDFNKAYNPYCAYNHRYSCVIPPSENWLPVRIEAGEKKFEE